jgi:hypothetical protein
VPLAGEPCSSTPYLGDKAVDGQEGRSPAGIGVGGDQDVTRFEVGVGDIVDDVGSSFDGPCRDGKTDQRSGRGIDTAVGSGHDLALGGEHAWWAQPFVASKLFFALLDEPVVDAVRPNHVVELFEPQVEDVVSLAEDAGADQAVGFLQQRLPVDEVPADRCRHRRGCHGIAHPRLTRGRRGLTGC